MEELVGAIIFSSVASCAGNNFRDVHAFFTAIRVA